MRPSRKSFGTVVAGAAAVGACGLAAALAHGQASVIQAEFVTSDDPDSFVRTSGTGANSRSATIEVGGKVRFSNGTGSSEPHNVRFTGAGVLCSETAPGSGTALTIPAGGDPSAGAWAGECTFSTAGAYDFVCDPHADDGMSGTVTVTAPGGNPPPPPPPGGNPPPPPGGTPPPPPGGTPPPPGGSPPSSAARLAISVAASQRGSAVNGRIVGARAQTSATVELRARRADVGAAGRRTALVRVGRLSRRTPSSGNLDFTVPLDQRARRALARRGRLSLRVAVSATTESGARRTRTFAVVLRPVRRLPARATVILRDNLFSPSTVELRRGGTVTWLWHDQPVPHDVVGRGFRSRIVVTGTFNRRFASPGTYTYVCSLHRGMDGRVVVR